jgi:hypothetical protein
MALNGTRWHGMGGLIDDPQSHQRVPTASHIERYPFGWHSFAAILRQALARGRWDDSTTPPLLHKLGILAHRFASDRLYLLSLLSRHLAATDTRDKAFSGRRSKPPYLPLTSPGRIRAPGRRESSWPAVLSTPSRPSPPPVASGRASPPVWRPISLRPRGCRSCDKLARKRNS